MDSETENKITDLQICIQDGHSYRFDKDALDGDNILLECSVCEYTHSVELTPEQLTAIDKLFDDENKLLKAILKNE